MNRIEQLISDMEQYIDSCKAQAFTGNRKIVVERGAVDDFLAELRMCMPGVIQRSEQIVNNKEAIITDARNQAEELLSKANEKTIELIDEHEIVQQAIQRGNEIVDQANQQAQDILNQAIREANAFKESAVSYTIDAMSSLRNLYEENITSTKALFEQHLIAMDERYQVIASNHDDFLASVNGAPAEQPEPEDDPEEDE
ncbi:MAG: vacuolar family H+-ATPase subunit H [Lachnospiraceae bacterium]|nr:vacuolar family H+-ATPase subunit H [Lachnospiraceae bacterium]